MEKPGTEERRAERPHRGSAFGTGPAAAGHGELRPAGRVEPHEPWGREWITDRAVRREPEGEPFLEGAERSVAPQDAVHVTWPGGSDDVDGLAQRLADTPAGPQLARLLDELSLPHLTTSALLASIEAAERQSRWARVQQMAAMSEAERRALLGGVDARVVPAEVSMRLRISPLSAQRRVDNAFDLHYRHPSLWRAVQSTELDDAKAALIARETMVLNELVPSGDVEALECRLAQRGTSLTYGRLRELARREVAKLIPSQVGEARHEEARQDRAVWVEPEPDGMARLVALLPAADAIAIMTVIDRMAGKDGATDTRKRPQRRADALAELMRSMLDADRTPLGPLPTAQCSRPHLLITVDPPFRSGSDEWGGVASLTGSVPPHRGLVRSPRTDGGPERAPREEPLVSLAGYGPITRGAVLRAAPDALVMFLRLDPMTGERHHTERATTPLSVADVLAPGVDRLDRPPAHGPPGSANTWPPTSESDPPGEHVVDGGRIAAKAARIAAAWDVASDRYRPLVELIRRVLLRDGTCTFGTCRMPAWRCQIDHIVPFDPRRAADQQTVQSNLHAVCAFHHELKTHGGWRVERDDATGHTTWTSPTGYSLTSRPEYLDK